MHPAELEVAPREVFNLGLLARGIHDKRGSFLSVQVVSVQVVGVQVVGVQEVHEAVVHLPVEFRYWALRRQDGLGRSNPLGLQE